MDALWPPMWPKKAELHVFDPEGDVLLILDRFALEGDLLVSESRSIQEGSITSETREPDSPEPKGESEILLFEPESSAKPGAKKVQMRVSSKHLILASAIFRTSLASDTYPEGRMLKAEGNVVIQLPDEDPDAMIILMNIVHPRSDEVPRRVNLNMLSKLAILVNRRHMHEAVGIWSDTWIENLKGDEGLPGSYVPEKLFPWLFIFWAFRKNEDFRKMSQILEQESDDRLEHDLEMVDISPYIPVFIIQAVQAKRIDAIEGMIAVIYDLITKYSGPQIICDNGAHFACDSRLLGSLLKSSAIIKIWPRPEKPYPGINAKALSRQILEMQIIDCCDGEGNYYSPSYSHGIQASIEGSMRSLKVTVSGLDLSKNNKKKKGRFMKGKKN